ncbi:MAG: acetyl-CoA carboxylase biotin carboxylase subunit [Acidobacteria bacterium]|nr:acetyl-CoA carboxylase biotin carboxylase subunit [Acidobacteriota bacterium]MBI3655432.1 acetyl-CoA carboxylase biotin carboxylase subunit [Acidobacteriota bacterium]
MKTLRKILIANRGEIALRVMRTCRAMGIATVAVYSDADRHAPFVRMADEAVPIGPPPSTASYLSIENILAAARRTSAEAIHPGYGFLSENAGFAQACADSGIIFIGPTAEAIRRMGSKVEAKKIMTAVGVPVIPGFSAEGLSDGEIERRARDMGYPVLIKASAGGGGKGMRIVREPTKLSAALAAARREAKSAFGDDTLLVERYFESPRHIEIQILGDAQGHVIHCFERECSIQRRYQKIIEEAPSPAVDEARRSRMGATAVAAGQAIGYQSAGTVEFVVDQSGQFYFLEVNTRLQVEHPVTEQITGLDLVRLQILIAQGEPLPLRQEDLTIRGHAIEGRIYAEDSRAEFLPSTGTIVRWEEARLPGIRYESGVETGSEITIHYDPLLAKVIAYAPTRMEAAQQLAGALAEMSVHGVRTNLPLLIEVLRHKEFLAGRLDTHFIDKHLSLGGPPTPDQEEADRVHAIAAALWLQERRRALAPVLRGIPSGWRNNPSQMQEVVFTGGGAKIQVMYCVHTRNDIEVALDGRTSRTAILAWDDRHVALVLDGTRRTYKLVSHRQTHYVHSPLGTSEFVEALRFPPPAPAQVQGGCHAPMPGKILSVRVAPGEHVRKGTGLVVLEAMKMEHEVLAPHAGKVREVPAQVGQQVEAGAVLVVIEEEAGETPA